MAVSVVAFAGFLAVAHVALLLEPLWHRLWPDPVPSAEPGECALCGLADESEES